MGGRGAQCGLELMTLRPRPELRLSQMFNWLNHPGAPEMLLVALLLIAKTKNHKRPSIGEYG